jgi:peptidyl-prolyl cis-trans isomerase C
MKNKKIIITSISAIALILISLASYKLFSNSDDKNFAQNDPYKIIVSTYTGGKITLREAQLELDKIILKNEKLRGLTFNNLTSDQKETIIKEIVLKKISYKEAKKRKLDKEKNYKEALGIFETELLKQQLYADISGQASKPENLKKNYAKLAKDLENKKDIKLRYIALKTKKEANSVHKILVKSPNSFIKQARTKSIDKEIAKKGGDLGFVLEDVLPIEITKVAKELKKGQISKPISLGDKWVIIKLEDQRQAQIAKFEDVKESLARNLSVKALQDFTSKSIKEANISILVK